MFDDKHPLGIDHCLKGKKKKKKGKERRKMWLE